MASRKIYVKGNVDSVMLLKSTHRIGNEVLAPNFNMFLDKMLKYENCKNVQ